MTNPLVSVIIPTYNRTQYICEAVDSVLAQTYRNIEVIVVDDGSTDNTEEILSQYDSKIKYVFQNNAGPSAARNNGIKQARGDLLAFLDSDDIWFPEKLERQIQLMKQSRNTGLVSCGSYIINVSGEITASPIIKKNHENKKLFLKELMVHNVVSGGGSAALIKKKCFEELGLFSENLWIGEDWDMWIRIAKHYDIRFVEEPLIKCRAHGNNLHANTSRIEADAKQVVARNIERWRFILRRKACSYIYLDLAHEYMAVQSRYPAMTNILRSIVIYPLKTYDRDDKYRILCKCLLPARLLSFVRGYAQRRCKNDEIAL